MSAAVRIAMYLCSAVAGVAVLLGWRHDVVAALVAVLGVLAAVDAHHRDRVAPLPDRAEFLRRRFELEAECGIDHDPDEVAELAALEPKPPEARDIDRGWTRVEDIDFVFGFPVDHRSLTVTVPTSRVATVQAWLDRNGVGLRARCDWEYCDDATDDCHGNPRELEVLEARDDCGNVYPIVVPPSRPAVPDHTPGCPSRHRRNHRGCDGSCWL